MPTCESDLLQRLGISLQGVRKREAVHLRTELQRRLEAVDLLRGPAPGIPLRHHRALRLGNQPTKERLIFFGVGEHEGAKSRGPGEVEETQAGSAAESHGRFGFASVLAKRCFELLSAGFRGVRQDVGFPVDVVGVGGTCSIEMVRANSEPET